MSLDVDNLLDRARGHSWYLNRPPKRWWDDEHVLDNGQSAVLIDRLVRVVDELRDQIIDLDISEAERLADDMTVDEHREFMRSMAAAFRRYESRHPNSSEEADVARFLAAAADLAADLAVDGTEAPT